MIKKRKVLLLESEAIIALDLKSMLQKADCDLVRTFKSFPTLFENIPVYSPDIIIVDSNEDLVPEYLKKITDDLKINVIYLSEFSDNNLDKLNPVKFSLLKKPYQKKDFITAIEKYRSVL